MNRSKFLKSIGLGALAVIVAPKIIAEVIPEPELIIESTPKGVGNIKEAWDEWPENPTTDRIVIDNDQLWLRGDTGIYIDKEKGLDTVFIVINSNVSKATLQASNTSPGFPIGVENTKNFKRIGNAIMEIEGQELDRETLLKEQEL